MHTIRRIPFGYLCATWRRFAIAVVVAACSDEPPPPVDTALSNAACDTAAARTVVERFGERLSDVSLLADDSVAQRQIREVYAPYVTPALLEIWVHQPDSAPGRKVSSPWPERIVVDSVSLAGLHTCRVTGHVVYTSTADRTSGDAGSRERVVLRVTGDSAWRIDTYATQRD